METVTHLVTSYSINVDHKSHTTSITLKLWVIKRLFAWHAGQRVHIHCTQLRSVTAPHTSYTLGYAHPTHTHTHVHTHTDTRTVKGFTSIVHSSAVLLHRTLPTHSDMHTLHTLHTHTRFYQVVRKWNTLPSDPHNITDTSTFRKWLKNVLFDRAYNWLQLVILDESYSGALQISCWLLWKLRRHPCGSSVNSQQTVNKQLT